MNKFIGFLLLAFSVLSFGQEREKGTGMIERMLFMKEEYKDVVGLRWKKDYLTQKLSISGQCFVLTDSGAGKQAKLTSHVVEKGIVTRAVDGTILDVFFITYDKNSIYCQTPQASFELVSAVSVNQK